MNYLNQSFIKMALGFIGLILLGLVSLVAISIYANEDENSKIEAKTFGLTE